MPRLPLSSPMPSHGLSLGTVRSVLRSGSLSLTRSTLKAGYSRGLHRNREDFGRLVLEAEF